MRVTLSFAAMVLKVSIRITGQKSLMQKCRGVGAVNTFKECGFLKALKPCASVYPSGSRAIFTLAYF
jgi:hypothetical protein